MQFLKKIKLIAQNKCLNILRTINLKRKNKNKIKIFSKQNI